MSKYIYHFKENYKTLSESFESRLRDDNDNHEKEYFDNVQMLLALNRHGACLDVGAGMGRVTAIAREVMAETVALEPDESRWNECHKGYHREPDCQVLCQTTGDYIRDNPGKYFDLAVVGMVIQHVSTQNCDRILSEVAQLLKPGAVAVIFTTHTLEECKGFSLTGDEERRFIPEEEFNAYADSDPTQQNLGLPVHRFSKQDLMDAVGKYLTPIYWRQTSYYKPEKLKHFAWRLGVDPEMLKDTGNSQFVVAQKIR